MTGEFLIGGREAMNPPRRLQFVSGDHQIVFRPDGRCSALLGHAILRFIRSGDIGPEDDVYFDLSAADALESTFAGMLVNLARQGQKRGRPFVHLVTPSQLVIDALQQLGVIKYFDVCSSLPVSLETWNSLPIEQGNPDDLADLDYIAGRASMVMDLTDSLENYTILTYAHSENNGSVSGLFACNPNLVNGRRVGFATFCDAQLAAQDQDFYAVESLTADPLNELEQWQAINTTSWAATETFTIKNILAYADLEQTTRTSVFGTNFLVPTALPVIGGMRFSFTSSAQVPGLLLDPADPGRLEHGADQLRGEAHLPEVRRQLRPGQARRVAGSQQRLGLVVENPREPLRPGAGLGLLHQHVGEGVDALTDGFAVRDRALGVALGIVDRGRRGRPDPRPGTQRVRVPARSRVRRHHGSS